MNEDPLRPPNDQSNLNWIFYLNSIILFAQNQLTTCYWRRVIECYSRKKALCTFIRRSNQPTSERDDQYGRVLPWPRIKREWLLHLFTISDEAAAAAAAATDPHTESSLGVGLCVASPLSLLTHFFFFSLCDYYYYSPSPLVFLGLVLVLLPVLVLFVNDDHHCSHWRSLYATTPHREISHSLARSFDRSQVLQSLCRRRRRRRRSPNDWFTFFSSILSLLLRQRHAVATHPTYIHGGHCKTEW